MTIVSFDAEKVRALLAHTRANTVMSPCFEHMAEPKFWKPGVAPVNGPFVRPEDVDVSKIEPHLLLVKDSGAYLMSGSSVPLHEPGTPKKWHFVVYGEGYSPDDYEDVDRVFGGDDFTFPLPLFWFDEMLRKTGKIRIRVLAGSFEPLLTGKTSK